MAHRISIPEMSGAEQPGTWLSARMYGRELPVIEQARFVIERSASGLWSTAIRGFNGGEPIDIVPTNRKEFSAKVDGVEYEAFGFFDQVLAVTEEEAEPFQQAVRLPQPLQGTLVEVLEQEEQGVWDLMAPAEYNDYDSFGQLIYKTPDEAALSWGDYTGDPESGDISGGGYAGYFLHHAKLAKVRRNGPLFDVAPLDRSRGLTVSSIRERIRNYPILAPLASHFTEEHELALSSMREAFEFGLEPLAEKTDPPPLAIIHGIVN